MSSVWAPCKAPKHSVSISFLVALIYFGRLARRPKALKKFASEAEDDFLAASSTVPWRGSRRLQRRVPAVARTSLEKDISFWEIGTVIGPL